MHEGNEAAPAKKPRPTKNWVFDVSCGIHASKSWVMGAPIR